MDARAEVVGADDGLVDQSDVETRLVVRAEHGVAASSLDVVRKKQRHTRDTETGARHRAQGDRCSVEEAHTGQIQEHDKGKQHGDHPGRAARLSLARKYPRA